MKRITICSRIIIWYTVLMLLLTGILFGLTLFISRKIVRSDLCERLQEFVEENSTEFVYQDGSYVAGEGYRGRENGMLCVAYDTDGGLLAGRLPENLKLPFAFKDGQIQEFRARERTYYLYDKEMRLPDQTLVRLRGLIYDRESGHVMLALLQSVLLVLPCFIIFSGLGGSIIIKKAFRPLEQVILTADEISAGEDLSKRIPCGEAQDEITKLTQTFNHMLQRLEKDFAMEQQYISNVSHELRTPVTVILSQCEASLENPGLTMEEREVLECFSRQAKRISKNISRFLLFGRLENGLEKIELEPVDFSALVQKICAEYVKLPGMELELHTQIEKEVCLAVNREMMRCLLENLLDNACKYGRKGKNGGTIWVVLKKEPEQVVLSVSDEGIGMTQQEQEQIWNRFYQTDRAQSLPGNTGIGLGLFMVQEIARLHGGLVQVESEPDKGSTFTLLLKNDCF